MRTTWLHTAVGRLVARMNDGKPVNPVGRNVLHGLSITPQRVIRSDRQRRRLAPADGRSGRISGGAGVGSTTIRVPRRQAG